MGEAVSHVGGGLGLREAVDEDAAALPLDKDAVLFLGEDGVAIDLSPSVAGASVANGDVDLGISEAEELLCRWRWRFRGPERVVLIEISNIRTKLRKIRIF